MSKRGYFYSVSKIYMDSFQSSSSRFSDFLVSSQFEKVKGKKCSLGFFAKVKR